MGVEEEFLLVDEHGRLASDGPEVLTSTAKGSGEVQQELARCQIESASPVCTGAWELLNELRGLRRRLASSAHERGLRMIAVGTPLFAETGFPPLSPDPRYRRMREQLGPLLDVGYTCGCHVHVAVPDPETGLRVSNRLRPWLPVLLALTANSPVHEGVDTTYASWRHTLWTRLPSASPPPLFESLHHYESSIQAALTAEAALDRGMIYWDVRLSQRYPTLEIRICDVSATAEEATLTAVLIRGLVATFLTEAGDGRPPPGLMPETLRVNLWRAARDGLEGCCLDPVTGKLIPTFSALQELIARIRPALVRSGDIEFADSMVATLRGIGSAAHRQRSVFARRNRISDVVDHLAQATTGGIAAVGGDGAVLT